ncbi:MAG: hypothetical protein ACRD9Q_02220, partial [Nitrososphaeraceae archaeon]
MENIDYNKIAREEKRLSYIMELLPGIILGIILFFLVLFNADLFILLVYFAGGIFGTTFVFLLVFLRPTISFRRKSVKMLFDKIVHERLLIRYRNLLFSRREYLKFFLIFLLAAAIVLYADTQTTTNDPATRIQTENFLIGLVVVSGIV